MFKWKFCAIMLAIAWAIYSVGLFTHASLFPSRNFYARSGEVISVDRDTDVVEWRDSVGYVWGFCGCEDWQPGDGIACVMNDKGTPWVFDDEVVNARYERR